MTLWLPYPNSYSIASNFEAIDTIRIGAQKYAHTNLWKRNVLLQPSFVISKPAG